MAFDGPVLGAARALRRAPTFIWSSRAQGPGRPLPRLRGDAVDGVAPHVTTNLYVICAFNAALCGRTHLFIYCFKLL